MHPNLRRLAVIVAGVVVAAGLTACLPPTAPTPALEADPESVTMAAGPYGADTAEVWITNVGSDTLGQLDVSLQDTSGPGSIGVMGQCADVDNFLPPGGSCLLQLSYTNPTGTGTTSATLHVVGGGTVLDIPVTGTGTPGGLELALDGEPAGTPPIAILLTTQAADHDNASFILLNTSAAAIGPVHFELQNTFGIGDFSTSFSSCEGVTLAPGEGCGSATVGYTNGTGSGAAYTELVASATGAEARASIFGLGH